MAASDPARALTLNWPSAINDDKPAYLVGAGKASLEMALQAESLYQGALLGGAVAVVPQRLEKLETQPRHFTAYPAAHPLPDERNIVAANAIKAIAERAGEGERVVVLISGGGSAHLMLPAGDLTLEDIRQMTNLLMRTSAPIQDLNTVRKHLEVLKGGGLARLADPAELWAFILSDVVGDPLTTIASGPTVPDPSTYADALDILYRYGVAEKLPRIVTHLKAGMRGEFPETLKEGDRALTTVTNLLIGSNRQALLAARQQATRMGFEVMSCSTGVEGDAGDMALRMADQARGLLSRSERPCCSLIGGETTVTVTGTGYGGRNQHAALVAAIAIEGMAGVAIATFATDGVDGRSTAAGAIVTGETCQRARAAGISPEDHLANNDSNTFFKKAGGLIETGPTGTNVNDIAILLTY